MKKMKNPYRFIFAAGGTGGHLYPAIAVADAIKKIKPEAEIMFVGTKNKLEARVIPQLGYKFSTIWISGFPRKNFFKIISFGIKLITASFQALILNIKFKPTVAIGAGAYVSGPVLWAASMLGFKIMLLEQNSYPGVTNRMLEKKADEIHISFEDSKKYFRQKEKLILSGNPVRFNIEISNKAKAKEELELDTKKKTLLVLGGSLGAASINKAVKNSLENFAKNEIQIIWQTGKNYFDEYKNLKTDEVKILPFIDNMGKAYSAADLIISRAGATTIAEAAHLKLPVIFVPSPHVAENHQYKNAKSIIEKNGCKLIEDNLLEEKLRETVIALIKNNEELEMLKNNIESFSKPNAAESIAKSAIKFAEKI